MSTDHKAGQAGAPTPQTLSIPEAGFRYFGLSRNGSYDAAERGDIPYLTVGKLKRVPIVLMERLMQQTPAAPAASAPTVAAPEPSAARTTRSTKRRSTIAAE
jgi:hypothetical protein